jgi:hypothetical protein
MNKNMDDLPPFLKNKLRDRILSWQANFISMSNPKDGYGAAIPARISIRF